MNKNSKIENYNIILLVISKIPFYSPNVITSADSGVMSNIPLNVIVGEYLQKS